MKVRLDDAAKRLHLHPCELVLNLAQMVGSFDDLYPELDEGYIETLKQLLHDSSPKSSLDITEKTSRPLILKDSHAVISVLSSKGFWKKNTIERDTLKKRYCKHIVNLDTAINELQREEIVIIKKGGNILSLNPKKRKVIEEIISDGDLT
jgi:hypothetical protein